MSQSVQIGSYLTAIITSVVSSASVWGLLQHFMTRRQRRQQTEQAAEEASRRRAQADDERRQLLAAAQATAQRTALDSASSRYEMLHTDYLHLRDGLVAQRQATSLLIGILESIISRLRPTSKNDDAYSAVMSLEDVTSARTAINEARRYLT